MRRRRGRMRNVQTARRSVRSFVKRLSFVEFAIHFVCAARKMLSIDGADSIAAQKYATLFVICLPEGNGNSNNLEKS